MKTFIGLLLCMPAWATSFERSIFPVALELRSSETSTDGNCGSNSDVGATCLGFSLGDCCSEKGFCGASSAYCGEGCQSDFGTCAGSSTQVISTSGKCGVTSTSNTTCQGSTWGNCCSAQGFCGASDLYCSTGCQSGFGTCGKSTSGSSSTKSSTSASASSTAAASSSVSSSSVISSTSSTASSTGAQATATSAVSVSGNCGSNSKTEETCLGSTFGDCCSHLGYCGGNSSYCDTGCQSSFGTCGSFGLGSGTNTSSNATGTSKAGITAPTSVLSTGAKAGISIAAAALGIALLGALAWYVIRKRKSPRKGSHELGAGTDEPLYEDHHEYYADKTKSELASPDSQRAQVMVGLPTLGPQGREGAGSGPMVHEMGSMYGAAHEMEGGRMEPVELDALDKMGKERLRVQLVDDRVAAGYDGAYRGN